MTNEGFEGTRIDIKNGSVQIAEGDEDAIQPDHRFVFQYFQSMRDEIQLRIRQHTRLVWIKIFVMGGLMSFILSELVPSQESLLLHLVWFLPIMGLVFDVLIGRNQLIIRNIGAYIRE